MRSVEPSGSGCGLYFEPAGRLPRWLGWLCTLGFSVLWLLGAHRHGGYQYDRDKQRARTSNPHSDPFPAKTLRATPLDRTDCVQSLRCCKGRAAFPLEIIFLTHGAIKAAINRRVVHIATVPSATRPLDIVSFLLTPQVHGRKIPATFPFLSGPGSQS